MSADQEREEARLAALVCRSTNWKEQRRALEGITSATPLRLLLALFGMYNFFGATIRGVWSIGTASTTRRGRFRGRLSGRPLTDAQVRGPLAGVAAVGVEQRAVSE
jgi:hypothetical protein